MSDQEPPSDRPLPPQGDLPPPPPGQPGAPGGQYPPGGPPSPGGQPGAQPGGQPGAQPPGGQPGAQPPGGQYQQMAPWQQGGVVPPSLEGPFYSAGLVILLSIVTCGIWTAVWSFHTGEDLKRYNNDGFGGAINLVFWLLVSPVLMFTIPMEIERMYQRDGRQSPVSTLWGLWFLLPIIGNFIWYLKVQEALNDFWVSKGARTA